MTPSDYQVKLEPDTGGIWTAEVPALGIVTEGRGQTGARRAADSAVKGYIRSAEMHGLTLPPSDVTRTFTASRSSEGWGARVAGAVVAAISGRKKSTRKTTGGRKATASGGRKKSTGGRKTSAPRRTASRKTAPKKTLRRKS